MNVAAPSADERLGALAAKLGGEPGVSFGERKGFGAGTLMVNGRIFAMVSEGRLILRLRAARVAELIAAGRGHPFSAGKPRPLREWVGLDPAGKDWLELAREALAFVRA